MPPRADPAAHRRTRVAFFGSRPVAGDCLAMLLAHPRAEVVAVCPSAAGGDTWASRDGAHGPGEVARRHVLPLVERPEDILGLDVDLVLSIYFDRLLSPDVLAHPRFGAVNLHGGPLPEYRGRMIAMHAILNGDAEHGATLHYMDAGADTGDIIECRRFPVPPAATARDLYDRTTEAARDLFRDHLDALLTGPVAATPQGPGRYLYTHHDALPDEVDTQAPQAYLARLVRALTFPPFPPPWTRVDGRRIEVVLPETSPARGSSGLDVDLPYLRSAPMYAALAGSNAVEAECDAVEQHVRRFARRPVRDILDAGCGPGLHAVELAARGYRVTAVDRSSTMVAIARARAARASRRVRVRRVDAHSADLGRRFDVVLLMRSFGELAATSDAEHALRDVVRHLRPGAILLLDAWRWPPEHLPQAVHATVDGVHWERHTIARLDELRRLVHVRHRFSVDGRPAWEEAFEVRMFTPDELAAACTATDLHVEHIEMNDRGLRPEGVPSFTLVARRSGDQP